MATPTFLFPKVQKGSLLDTAAEAAVVPLFEDGQPPFTKALDKRLHGLLSAKVRSGRFEAEKGKTLWVDLPVGARVPRLLLVGLGRRGAAGDDAIRDAYASAASECSAAKRTSVLLPIPVGGGLEKRFESALEGFLLATYRFNKYKKKPESVCSVRELTVLAPDARSEKAFASVAAGVSALVQATFRARDLVNEPANVVHPSAMEAHARAVAKEKGLGIKVFQEEELQKRGMNLILAVGMGSVERPRLVHLEYKPKGKIRRHVALIGKGVTFDSGGLSLKGQDNMYGMKCDMSGSAAVLSAMWGVAELGLPVHVHGIFPLVENLPSHHSTKPGDVVVGLNGKSVEIENTDAEGRLILADALTYAGSLGVDETIDAATLTGACVVALGEDIAGVMSNNAPLVGRIRKAGSTAGEKFWELPLEKPYARLLKSDVADLKNVGGRMGGAITAAVFLSEFVPEKMPWAHLDIAGPAFVSHEWPTAPKGATGFAVRTFLRLLASY
jgi:leucyl aminopeptidase